MGMLGGSGKEGDTAGPHRRVLGRLAYRGAIRPFRQCRRTHWPGSRRSSRLTEFASFEKKYFGERVPLDGPAPTGIKHFFTSLTDGLRTKMHVGMSLFTSAMVAERDLNPLYEKIFEGISLDTLKFPFAAPSPRRDRSSRLRPGGRSRT